MTGVTIESHLGGPVRHHFAVLGHVALQHLVARVDQRHVLSSNRLDEVSVDLPMSDMV
jgi:hypothetical protein